MKKKIIKRIYGGDAKNIKELLNGDCMTVDLLNKAIRFVIEEAYITKNRITVILTDRQLIQIKPKRCEFFAFIYFLPITTYLNNKDVQTGYVSCGDKQINIYTKGD